MPTATPFLTWSFAALVVLVALLFVLAVRAVSSPRATMVAAARTAAWLALTAGVAASGKLSFSSRPPTMPLLLVATLALAIGISRSARGARLATGLPLAVLVGFQGFRIGVEVLLHRAYVEGLVPVQMSWSGLNFDVVSGLTALVVGVVLAAGRGSRALVLAWSVLGLLLLANIVTVALLSAPTPQRAFHNEPANTWIEHAPWVWLPAALVLAALLGHLLVFRRLRLDRQLAAGRAPTRSAAA